MKDKGLEELLVEAMLLGGYHADKGSDSVVNLDSAQEDDNVLDYQSEGTAKDARGGLEAEVAKGILKHDESEVKIERLKT